MRRVVRPVTTVVLVAVFAASLWYIKQVPFQKTGIEYRLEKGALAVSAEEETKAAFTAAVFETAQFAENRVSIDDFHADDVDIVAVFRFEGDAPGDEERDTLSAAVQTAVSGWKVPVETPIDGATIPPEGVPASFVDLANRFRDGVSDLASVGGYWEQTYINAYIEYAATGTALALANEYYDYFCGQASEECQERAKLIAADIGDLKEKRGKTVAALADTAMYVDTASGAFLSDQEAIGAAVTEAGKAFRLPGGSADTTDAEPAPVGIEESDAPIAWTLNKAGLPYIIAALAAIAIIAFLWLKPTSKRIIRDVQQVREQLGIPVIGAVSVIPG